MNLISGCILGCVLMSLFCFLASNPSGTAFWIGMAIIGLILEREK